jgi:hypothetical protein
LDSVPAEEDSIHPQQFLYERIALAVSCMCENMRRDSVSKRGPTEEATAAATTLGAVAATIKP